MNNVHITADRRFTRKILVYVNGEEKTDMCLRIFASPNPGEITIGWAETLTKNAAGEVLVTPDMTELVRTVEYGTIMWDWQADACFPYVPWRPVWLEWIVKRVLWFFCKVDRPFVSPSLLGKCSHCKRYHGHLDN